MDMLDTLGNLAEIVGTIIVIASLVFVGMEMRHNTKQLVTTQLGNILEIEIGSMQMHQQLTLEIARDKELADIVIKGSVDITSLDINELTRFSVLMGGVMSMAQVGYLHYLEGHQNEEIWQSQSASLMSLLARPGTISWWQMTRNNYAAPFREWIDGLLGLGPLAPPGLPPDHPGQVQTAVKDTLADTEVSNSEDQEKTG